jgi:hypothetical protein
MKILNILIGFGIFNLKNTLIKIKHDQENSIIQSVSAARSKSKTFKLK